MNKVASDQTRVDIQNFDWEVVYKPRILCNMKYGISVRGFFDDELKEFDDDLLEDPPTTIEYQRCQKWA